MARTLHHIDQLFHSAIGSYEENPSEKVWKDIENKLNKRNAEKYKRKFNMLRMVVAFLIVTLLGVGVYEAFKVIKNNYSSSGNNISQNTLPVIPTEKNPVINERTNISPGRHQNYSSPIRKQGKDKSIIKPTVEIISIHAISTKPYLFNKSYQPKIVLIDANKIYGHKVLTVGSKLSEDSGALKGKQVVHLNKESIDKKRHDRKLPFSIRLIAGPDWSTVKFKQWTNPGLDLGLKVGYQFTSSWNVETGIFVNDKDFTSYPKDFKPLNNSPDNDLDEVTADLKVINLPLNISYSLWSKRRDQFAVSLGISSYWFLTEEYTYRYKRNSGREDKHWELESMNKNILSIINASVDYQYYFNRKISLSIEPYFQLPVSKIGYGRVNMQSVGVHVGAAYHF